VWFEDGLSPSCGNENARFSTECALLPPWMTTRSRARASEVWLLMCIDLASQTAPDWRAEEAGHLAHQHSTLYSAKEMLCVVLHVSRLPVALDGLYVLLRGQGGAALARSLYLSDDHCQLPPCKMVSVST
jgi:hypothetical protein